MDIIKKIIDELKKPSWRPILIILLVVLLVDYTALFVWLIAILWLLYQINILDIFFPKKTEKKDDQKD